MARLVDELAKVMSGETMDKYFFGDRRLGESNNIFFQQNVLF